MGVTSGGARQEGAAVGAGSVIYSTSKFSLLGRPYKDDVFVVIIGLIITTTVFMVLSS